MHVRVARSASSGPPCAHMTRTVRFSLWLLAGAVALGLGVACAPADEAGGGYRGMILTSRVDKPDFTFTDTDGRPFAFRAATDGFVTLLFFGYTHCPDICPLHMAGLGEVLRSQPADVVSRIKVVFVTTDPDRDSLAEIRRWLDQFDPRFIGLRAPLAEVNPVLAALLLPQARLEPLPGGEMGVAHPAAILAFTRDNTLRVAYPFGVHRDDWARDLPRLVRDPGLEATQPR